PPIPRPSPVPRLSPPSQPPPIASPSAATIYNSQLPTEIAPSPYAAPAYAATVAAPPVPLQPPVAAPEPHARAFKISQPPPAYGSHPITQPPPLANGYQVPLPGPGSGQRIAEDPWRESLKLVMIVWGLLTIAAIATPLSLDPLGFAWDGVLNGSTEVR